LSTSSFTEDSAAADDVSLLAAACAARLQVDRAAPVISVIVPVYDNWTVTQRCLASVLWCDPEISIELIVVDDASTDETPESLARLPGLTVIRNTVNVGFVHGCNSGAAVARGKYLFFLNNDTQLHADSIAALVRRIEPGGDIGIVGSKLVYPDGTLQEAGGIIWADGFAWNFGKSDDVDRPEYNFTRDVDYVSGAALLVRADLFRELGGFDERFAPAYYEDADLCFAARAHGMRVVYEPSSVVTHYEGLTAGRDLTAGMKRFYEINRPKFASKWYSVLRREHYAYSEANVPRAARRSRGKPAVFVAGSTLAPSGRGPSRLEAIANAFAAAGHRVACLPHDLAGSGPARSRLQGAGVEVILRSAEDQRDVSTFLAESLATVDAAVLVGAEAARRYLPVIRAARDIAVLYDAAESARARWDADELSATCVRAADGTIVASQVEAEQIRAAGFGPVVVVPPEEALDPRPAIPLFERVV
jgi:GT2 family glycosyltransferase/predicted regulator of Ras-like GTPase activity (Roadblock/LC7/MglB family)